MSKKKDIERAKTEGPFRDGERGAPALVKLKCIFPPCPAVVLVAPPLEGVAVGSPQHMSTLGGIPMCDKHGDMLNFHVWAITSIKMEAQRTPGGLVLPGHEKFKAAVKQGPAAQSREQEKSFDKFTGRKP